MARKRQGRHDEVMLIPFLDILCSLIGVLILIIVVVCVAQVQKVKGRTKQDVALAQRYNTLLNQQKELEQAVSSLRTKVSDIDQLQKGLAEKQRKLEELRKTITSSASNASANKKKAEEIQKEIANLIAQIESITKAVPPIQAEIEKLKKLIAERQLKINEKPAVIVKPSGSGAKQNQHVFFVEANGAGIVIHKSKTEQLRVAQANLNMDKDYDAFLKTVKNTGKSALIFLIRKDGWGTYTKAAGWAEQEFGLNTGKLPVPSDGALDLSLFQKP